MRNRSALRLSLPCAALSAPRCEGKLHRLGGSGACARELHGRAGDPARTARRAAADCGKAGNAAGQSGRLPAAAGEYSAPAQTLPPIRPSRRLLRPPDRRLAQKNPDAEPLRLSREFESEEELSTQLETCDKARKRYDAGHKRASRGDWSKVFPNSGFTARRRTLELSPTADFFDLSDSRSFVRPPARFRRNCGSKVRQQ